METATNIYVGQTLVHCGTPCSCVGASATKGDDAVSHWCNPYLHPCAQDLKQAQQQREPSLEKSQLCPQALLSSDHLPVKTSEPRLISNGIHPNPHISLTHTSTYFLHTPLQTTLKLKHIATHSCRLYQPSKLILLAKYRISLEYIENQLNIINSLEQNSQ